MIIFSPRYDDIRWILGMHGRREDLPQDLVPVFTPSHPSSPEVITNEKHSPRDGIGQHECTGED